MIISGRRSALALLGAALLARPALAQGRTIVDSANRKVALINDAYDRLRDSGLWRMKEDRRVSG